MGKKPTTSFGTIDFGKDGSVRPNIRQLSDDKSQQEMSVGESFVQIGADLFDGQPSLATLKEADHDFNILIDGQTRIQVQCTEVVYPDFLAEPGVITQEGIALRPGTITPRNVPISSSAITPEGERPKPLEQYYINPTKRDNVFKEKIKLKKKKSYSKPDKLEFWLLIWSVTGYPFGVCDKTIELAREMIKSEGVDPFDRVLFFDLLTRPIVIWPI